MFMKVLRFFSVSVSVHFLRTGQDRTGWNEGCMGQGMGQGLEQDRIG